jgi:hypothetical protein
MRFGLPQGRLVAVLLTAGLVLAGCGGAEGVVEVTVTEAPTEEHDAHDAMADEPAPMADEPATTATEPVAEEPVALPEEVTVTAYVVAYHWGWAIFDESGRDLDLLRVPVGATVELFAVNDHASEAIAKLPVQVAEAIRGVDWHERVHGDVAAGRIEDPQAAGEGALSEALRAVHDDHHLRNHGLMVRGAGVRPVMLDAHAEEPEHLVFVVDEEGRYEFRCTEKCGFGHEPMSWEMLEVVSA